MKKSKYEKYVEQHPYIVHSSDDIKTLPCTQSWHDDISKAINEALWWLNLKGPGIGLKRCACSPQWILDREGRVIARFEVFDAVPLHNTGEKPAGRGEKTW